MSAANDGETLVALATGDTCRNPGRVVDQEGNTILQVWSRNLILLFAINDWCKKSAFYTNTQSRFASVVVGGVFGPPRLAQDTLRCACISVVPEATHEAS